jgi:hypothetical protein
VSRSVTDIIDALERAEMAAKSSDARRVLRDERLGLMAALQRPAPWKRPTYTDAYDLRTGRTTDAFEASLAHGRAAAKAAAKPSIGELCADAEKVLEMWEGL